MNIFYLHSDPIVSAQAMTNKHVVKMILESAQIMSTAHHVINEGQEYLRQLYKPTHKNHPSSVWVRQSPAHYQWLYEHFQALCKEYTRRYGRTHLTETKLDTLLKDDPYMDDLDFHHFEEPPQCMPDEYKSSCAVTGYRNYYLGEKISLEQDRIRFDNILEAV